VAAAARLREPPKRSHGGFERRYRTASSAPYPAALMTEPSPEPKSLVERALGVVTEVRAGEGVTALLLTLNLFLLMAAYYILKPIRDSLIVNVEGGAEYKSYMGGAIAIALLFAVPAYGWVASRLQRNRLLIGVSLFFVSNLVLFYFLSLMPMTQGGRGGLIFALAFFLWVGVFNMMIVAQFWAFANDVYDDEQGKRLFALVGMGASLGSVAGSVLPALAEKLGTKPLFLIAAALLGVSALLIQTVHVRETKGDKAGHDPKDGAPASAEEAGADAKGKSRGGPFGMVIRHRYLLLIAIFSAVFTLANTNGEYILGKLAKAESAGVAEPGKYLTAFYGQFYLIVNLVGLGLQTFVVSRLVKFLGFRFAFFILPVIALADATGVALLPILAIARIGKIAENSVDYSLNNTLRNMLWLPTTREEKYQAKQAVDTFFVRMGDVGSGLVVFVLIQTLGLGVRAMALTNVVLVAVWLVVAKLIVTENAKLTKEREAAAGEEPAR
jgi:AAA family ATP:ADP antiporter